MPNPNLLSERATGWEAGVHTDLPSIGSTVRVSYFWTQINRPITALTLSTTPTSSLLMRENLGQIESRGVSLDFASRPVSWVSLEGGYQYADATVTSNAKQPKLVGNWIPQVARNMATTQVAFSRRRFGLLSVQGRISGRQYDDDANQFLLHSYFRLGAYASHDFGHHLTAFAAGDNLVRSHHRGGENALAYAGFAARRAFRVADQFRRVAAGVIRSQDVGSAHRLRHLPSERFFRSV